MNQSASAPSSISAKKHAGVLHIGFDRPDKKNAITFEMYADLATALKSASCDAEVRVALLHGSLDAFTAGNDLGDFRDRERPDPPPSLAFQQALLDFEKPLIAAVAGPAVGIGSTLLLHCDMVFCASNARFAFPFVNLGLVPEAASSFLLPRLAGWQKAAELLMLGEPFGPEEAQAIGLVTRIVSPEALMEAALAAAAKLAQKPPAALRLTKALMRRHYGEAAAMALTGEMEVFRRRLHSPEAKEAMSAFFEKRKPDFSRFN